MTTGRMRSRQKTESIQEKRPRSEQQSAAAALNYGARACFIRIPSLRCSLSGDIKEEDTIRLFIKAVPVAHTKDGFSSCRVGRRGVARIGGRDG